MAGQEKGFDFRIALDVVRMARAKDSDGGDSGDTTPPSGAC